MTTSSVYVGIENEFQLMKNSEPCNFKNYFDSLLRKYKYSVFCKSETSIRTKVGSALYADEQEPEVCTAPVRIRRGFARKATDALYLARKELVDVVSEDSSLSLIGYSTHWNITHVLGGVARLEIMRAFAVPYSLFTLTPLSCGINLRDKSPRLELLGDYIPDDDQIRAFLLFYAGTILNLKCNSGRLPFILCPNHPRNDVKYGNLVLDGRYSKVGVDILDNEHKNITAQTYLEVYYDFFREGIAELGTEDDVENLEDFIYGRRPLEIDRFKKYALANIFRDENDPKRFKTHPLMSVDFRAFKSERDLPDNLSRFLGSLANQKYGDGRIPIAGLSLAVDDLGWEYINFLDRSIVHPLENIELLSEVIAQSSDSEAVELIREFSTLNYSDLEERVRRGSLAISDGLKDRLLKAYDIVGNPKSIGEVPCLDFDLSDRLGRLESREIRYDPESDNSLPSILDDNMKIFKRRFSFRKAFSDTKLNLGFGDKFLLFLLGTVLGMFTVIIFSSPEKPGQIQKIEFHDMGTYPIVEKINKDYEDDVCLPENSLICEEK